MMALLLLCLFLFPQSRVEYGDPSELKGVTKVFVDTGFSKNDRDRIVKELEKQKAKLGKLEVVSTEAEAEVTLSFVARTDKTFVGMSTSRVPNTNTSVSSPAYNDEIAGLGYVYKPAGDGIRILIEMKDSKSTIWERHPATNFARAFIKAYIKANP